jgi:WD40 repeat protein
VATAEPRGVFNPDLTRASPTGPVVNVSSVGWSGDGKTLSAALRGNHSVYRVDWQLATGKQCGTGEWTGSDLLVLSPDGRKSAAVGRMGPKPQPEELYALSFREGLEPPKSTIFVPKPAGQWGGHASRVTLLAMSFDGRTVAARDEANVVKLWNVDTGLERRRLQHGQTITSLALSSDGKILIVGCDEGTVRIGDGVLDPNAPARAARK